ncbi:hypothetical protein YC6258_02473 [Gynuella sunshinyii YC6258]|uniref:Uncharacterized protein n=1 Tax=Gynuella sunshinyii YC6258 TaxID=1445510 RepID=A0A0C5VJP3_9GAMM|nr:hypothetical protein YC6258_02473 [Gynuella sunshinyii YC6258]
MIAPEIRSKATMMPLDRYEFSTGYSWVADRFGVSWQLNLPQ